MVFLNRPDGPSGQICGSKSGYSTVIKPPTNKDLNLAVRVQGPSYRWKIKITQIGCNEVKNVPNDNACGISNPPSSPFIQFNKVEARKICKNGKCMTRHLKRRPRRAVRPKEIFCRHNLRPLLGPNNVLTKIIDGMETGINQYPWVVSMQLQGNHFCGASLISDQWVLTAAHCVDINSIPNFLDRLVLSLGDHDVTTPDETASITRSVKRVGNYELRNTLPVAVYTVSTVHTCFRYSCIPGGSHLYSLVTLPYCNLTSLCHIPPQFPQSAYPPIPPARTIMLLN